MPQHRIARKVAVFVVDLLKVVNVDHRQRLRLFQLGLLVLEVAAPVRACYRIQIKILSVRGIQPELPSAARHPNAVAEPAAQLEHALASVHDQIARNQLIRALVGKLQLAHARLFLHAAAGNASAASLSVVPHRRARQDAVRERAVRIQLQDFAPFRINQPHHIKNAAHALH